MAKKIVSSVILNQLSKTAISQANDVTAVWFALKDSNQKLALKN